MKKTVAATKQYIKKHKEEWAAIRNLMKQEKYYLAHVESVFDPTPCKTPWLERYSGDLGQGYIVHDETRYNGTDNYKVIRYYIAPEDEPLLSIDTQNQTKRKKKK